MKGMLVRHLVALMLACPVVGQSTTGETQAAGDEISQKSIAYAVRATSGMRQGMHDPTAFTILQVTAITKQEKDGTITFSGCVHYVGSNLYGGRMQRHGSYQVNKKGQLTIWTGTETSYCETHKNEVHKDVTAEVQGSLSQTATDCVCKVVRPI